MVTVGSNGAILSADAPPVPGTPTVNMAAPAVSFTEGAAVVKAAIVVRLAPGSGSVVTVPFTVAAGTASATDYKVTTLSPLVFKAGDTEKLINVDILADNAVESGLAETFTVTLGTPFSGTVALPGGPVLLGTTTSTVASIINYDAIPGAVATVTPDHRIIPVGTSFSYSVSATGSKPLTTAWMKRLGTKEAAVGKATASTITIAAAKLTDAGAYRFRISNPVNRVAQFSAANELVVVDTVQQLPMLVKTTGTLVKMTQAAAGNNLTYQWKLDGNPISGATLPTYSVAVTQSTSGLYQCDVTSPLAGTLTGRSINVAIARLPVVTHAANSNLPDGYVGKLYSTQIATDRPIQATLDGDKRSGFATSYKLVGALPTGLKLNAVTGVISGRPTVPVVDRVFSVIASNIGGASVTVPVKLTIHPMKPGTLGKFLALIPRDNPLNRNLGGRIEVDTTVAGNLTGKVFLGTLTYPLVASFADPSSAVAGEVSATTTFLLNKKTVTVNLLFNGNTNTMTGSLQLGTLTPINLVQGWRYVYSKVAPNDVQGRKGVHNVLMQAPVSADESFPLGDGYLSLNVGADGIVKVSGKTADGLTTLTQTTHLGPNGEVLIYQGLYAAKAGVQGNGSLMGVLQIAASTPANLAQAVTQSALPGSDLTWNRGPQPTTQLTYRAGFPVTTLTVYGGLYLPPVTGGLILGAPAPILPALVLPGRLTFTAGGLDAGHPTYPDITLNLTKASPYTAVTGTNPAQTSIKFTASTGAFEGQFTLLDGTVKRVTKFYGLIVPNLGTADATVRTTADPGTWDGTGSGYFILDQLPQPGPKLSGQVVLERIP
jgi:hypothetical protein